MGVTVHNLPASELFNFILNTFFFVFQLKHSIPVKDSYFGANWLYLTFKPFTELKNSIFACVIDTYSMETLRHGSKIFLRNVSDRLHGIITDKTALIIFAAMKNLLSCIIMNIVTITVDIRLSCCMSICG